MLTTLRQDSSVTAIFDALESSPDAVFATDRHNRIVFWNDAARAVLGYDPDEVIGRACGELLKGCDDYGNRYCSEHCPVAGIASRGDIVQPFALKFVARDSGVTATSVAILQLRSRSDEVLLVHIVRPREPQPAPSVTAEIAPAPPQLVARESTDARARKLTPREVEVLGMLAAGRSTPEIADRLHISQLTTRDHIQHILEKLEVHSKAEAVAFAFHKNLI